MAPLLTRLDLRGIPGPLAPHLPAPEADGPGPEAAVRRILAEVRAGGDAAVRELTRRFDLVDVPEPRVAPSEVAAALAAVPADLRRAL